MVRLSPHTVPKAETLATITTMAAAAVAVVPRRRASTEQDQVQLPESAETEEQALLIRGEQIHQLFMDQVAVAVVTQRTASVAPTAVTDAAPMQAAPEVHTESTKQAEAAAVDG
jgi:hypothetical protein